MPEKKMNQNQETKVQIEETPNPQSLKFNLGYVFNDSPFECASLQDTERSPLAAKIFGFPWASNVFIGTDFVTVQKQDWVSWEVLADPLANLIEEHITGGEAVVISKNGNKEGLVESDNLDENAAKMKWIIENEIRPALASDGGDINFVKFENGLLWVKMQGACNGCPSASVTLKEGIETYMKEVFPEILQVVSV